MGPVTPVAETMPTTGKGTEVEEATRSLDWPDVERRLASNGWFWLASVRPDGAPHMMPLFAAWSEPVLFIASKDSARKSRNLDADGRCVLSTEADGAHLVVEGKASRVRDRATLERASAASSRSTAGRPRSPATSSTPTTVHPPRPVRRTASTRLRRPRSLHCPSTEASYPPGCASPDNAPT